MDTQTTIQNVAPIQPKINASDVGNVNPVVIPPAPAMTDVNALVASLNKNIQPLEQAVQTQENTLQNTQSDIQTLQKMLEGQTAETLQAEQAQGIPTLQKELMDLQNQARQQETQFLAGTVNAEGKRQTRAETTVAQQNLQRQYAVDAALTNSLISAKQGSIQYAQSLVDRAIAIKYEPIKASLNTKLQFYEMNKDNLSRADKKLFDEKTKEWNLQLKQVENQEENDKKSNEYLLTAIQGNAPQSLIKKAQDLIKSGAKSNEVASLLGRYSMSLADRLDVQLKQKQIDKINRELTEINPDAGELVKINGKDYIRYKDGTISEPVLPDASDIKLVSERLSDKISTVDKLARTTAGNRPVGLIYSAGALRTPLGKPPGFINEINNWRADVINVVSKLTVDELGRVKSDGVTFGALSNGEREAVGNAATVLNSGMIYSGKGDDRTPTGKFKISEDKVQEALDTINKYYLIDFERRTGLPYEEYKNNPEAIKNKAVDDFLNQAEETIINTSIYGGYPIE